MLTYSNSTANGYNNDDNNNNNTLHSNTGNSWQQLVGLEEEDWDSLVGLDISGILCFIL